MSTALARTVAVLLIFLSPVGKLWQRYLSWHWCPVCGHSWDGLRAQVQCMAVHSYHCSRNGDIDMSAALVADIFGVAEGL